MLRRIREVFAETYGRSPVVVTFAPGRIEIIGNHTDYNGGPVLGAAIDRGIWVALALRADGRQRFASDYCGDLKPVEIEPTLPTKRSGMDAWINYPLGVLSVLPSFGFQFSLGFDFLALSDLPSGAGLSSSAAIELASAMAFLAATGQTCSAVTLAQIGRKAENDFVGVPCGILDQGVSAFGQADHLVHLNCSTLKYLQLPLPTDANFWVFNTHTRHALVDGLYATRHRECLHAAVSLGVRHLAESTLEHLDMWQDRMPANVAKRARHILNEIGRVKEVTRLLAAGKTGQVGAQLTVSHLSSRQLFENSSQELDFLVDGLVAMPGVHGARLTGGGFGGAVLALTTPDFDAAQAAEVAESYFSRFGTAPDILRLRAGNGASVIAA